MAKHNWHVLAALRASLDENWRLASIGEISLTVFELNKEYLQMYWRRENES